MRFLLLLALAAATSTALASHEDDVYCQAPPGMPAAGIVEVGAGDPDATYYVDDRNYFLGNGIWVYQETNGVFRDPIYGNLQRGGSSVWVPDGSTMGGDPCREFPELDPDTLVF